MKRINVGLMGMGTIGTGSYKVLEMNRKTIENNSDCDIRITKVLVRNINKDRGVKVPPENLTENPEDIYEDPDIDIVIDTMGGSDPSYIKECMKHGKDVVTANKVLVANHFNELHELAKEHDVKFRYEASVGGGIPVINAIMTALGANEFVEILGILNGTTNYMLTKMTEYDLDYGDVLKDAQEKGFAEPDPTADVDGIDVANKVCILMALAFNHYVHPDDIPTIGITGITKDAIEKAKGNGCTIKLIGSIKRDEDGNIEYSVSPREIPNNHPLASVSNEFNAIYVTGNAVGELMFYGKGAGALPTGSAVIGDVIELAQAR